MGLNGCHNRPPLGISRMVADGHVPPDNCGLQTPAQVRYVQVPHAMSTDCHYTHSEHGRTDPGCTGCQWRAGVEPSATPPAGPWAHPECAMHECACLRNGNGPLRHCVARIR